MFVCLVSMGGGEQRPYSRQGSIDQSAMFHRPPSVGRAAMPGTPQFGQPATPGGGGTLHLQQHVSTVSTKQAYMMTSGVASSAQAAVGGLYAAPSPHHGTASFTTLAASASLAQHAHPLTRPAAHHMAVSGMCAKVPPQLAYKTIIT